MPTYHRVEAANEWAHLTAGERDASPRWAQCDRLLSDAAWKELYWTVEGLPSKIILKLFFSFSVFGEHRTLIHKLLSRITCLQKGLSFLHQPEEPFYLLRRICIRLTQLKTDGYRILAENKVDLNSNPVTFLSSYTLKLFYSKCWGYLGFLPTAPHCPGH